jgi:hypothetical protein
MKAYEAVLWTMPDGEPDEILFQRISTARKDHGPCRECGESIVVGQMYVRTCFPGSLTYKHHLVCEDLP